MNVKLCDGPRRVISRTRFEKYDQQASDKRSHTITAVCCSPPNRSRGGTRSGYCRVLATPALCIREVLGNRLPKHIYHAIVCIGALVAHRESDHWAVDALGAPHVGERTEKLASSVTGSMELQHAIQTFRLRPVLTTPIRQLGCTVLRGCDPRGHGVKTPCMF
jgi:hypothetical protein